MNHRAPTRPVRYEPRRRAPKPPPSNAFGYVVAFSVVLALVLIIQAVKAMVPSL